MVGRYLAFIALGPLSCRPSTAGAIAEAHADEAAASPVAKGVAVVELFTSEGCSSCPPADAVLAELAAMNASVYALAFHVDYWDDLGWPRRFATSRKASSARSAS
jgi:hypothetical protein